MGVPEGDYRSPERREHFVYRAFDAAGGLLYVGCTMQPEKRLAGHRANRAEWLSKVKRIRMAGPFNYDTARSIEREAIRSEDPAYNFTPQRQAAKQRRIASVKRAVASEIARLGYKPEMNEYLRIYDRFARQYDRQVRRSKAGAR